MTEKSIKGNLIKNCKSRNKTVCTSKLKKYIIQKRNAVDNSMKTNNKPNMNLLDCENK